MLDDVENQLNFSPEVHFGHAFKICFKYIAINFVYVEIVHSLISMRIPTTEDKIRN